MNLHQGDVCVCADIRTPNIIVTKSTSIYLKHTFLCVFKDCSRTDIKSKSGHINNDNFPSSVLPHTCKFWFYRGIPGEVLTVR